MDPTRRCPALPNELLSAILVEAMLEYLADGHQAEAAELCLVTRTCLTPLRIALYHEPTLRIEDDGGSQLALTGNVVDLHQTLVESPQLAMRVQGIVVTYEVTYEDAVPDMIPDNFWLNLLLAQALQLLVDVCPTLTNVGIIGDESELFDTVMRAMLPPWSTVPLPWCTPVLLQLAGRLEHFCVMGCSCAEEILDYLAILPNLRSVVTEPLEQHHVPSKKPTFALRHLQLVDFPVTSASLAHFACPSHLRSLEIDYGPSSGIISLSPFVALASLDIQLDGQADGAHAVALIEECKTLLHLILRHIINEHQVDADPEQDVFQRVAPNRFLARLPRTLRTLNISDTLFTLVDALLLFTPRSPDLQRLCDRQAYGRTRTTNFGALVRGERYRAVQ